MEPCGNGSSPSAAQRWRWNADGTIGNANGRCLSLKGSSRLISAQCDASEPEQRFRKHATMTGHIEAVAKPGSCLDMNAASAPPLIDTYACCECDTCCCECETWSFTATSAMLSAQNGQCVTEGPAARSGGAGSYVTLVPPEEQNAGATFTTVIETMVNAESSCGYGNSGWDDILIGEAAVDMRLCYDGIADCAKLPLHLWLTNLNGSSSVLFEEQPRPVFDAQCCVTLQLEPNSLYTLSTVATARKGSHPIASIAPTEGQGPGCGSVASWSGGEPFPLPYHTAFEPAQVRFRDFPEFMSDVQGVFRVVANPFGETGNALAQNVHASDPHTWAGLGKGVPPTTLFGADTWSDYTVSAVARLAPTSSPLDNVAVALRMGHNYEFSSIGGYKLSVSGSGAWCLNATGAAKSLAAGRIKGDVRATWQQLSLRAQGKTLTAKVNGVTLAQVEDGAWGSGYAGLSSGWHAAWFREASVTPAKSDDDAQTGIAPKVACAALAKVDLGPNTTVLSTTPMVANNTWSCKPMCTVSYCQINLLVRPGTIYIDVGLPSDGSFNGRFVASGDSGYAGHIHLGANSMFDGYASATTDTGHEANTTQYPGMSGISDGQFGMLRPGVPNTQAQVDFACKIAMDPFRFVGCRLQRIVLRAPQSQTARST